MAVAFTERGRNIARTLAAALSALDDHGKAFPAERAQLMEMLASHVRNVHPIAFQLDTGPVAFVDLAERAIEPETSVRVDLGDGASYVITIADGYLRLQFFDVTGDETMHHFELPKAKAFRDDVSRVIAAMEGKP